MERKVYMIMPNTLPSFDLGKFNAYIQSLHTMGYIYAWWHYIPGALYFVDTSLDVNQIHNLLIKHIPYRHFIVMEVNPKNQQGWLPKEAWDWFKTYK